MSLRIWMGHLCPATYQLPGGNETKHRRWARCASPRSAPVPGERAASWDLLGAQRSRAGRPLKPPRLLTLQGPRGDVGQTTSPGCFPQKRVCENNCCPGHCGYKVKTTAQGPPGSSTVNPGPWRSAGPMLSASRKTSGSQRFWGGSVGHSHVPQPRSAQRRLRRLGPPLLAILGGRGRGSPGEGTCPHLSPFCLRGLQRQRKPAAENSVRPPALHLFGAAWGVKGAASALSPQRAPEGEKGGSGSSVGAGTPVSAVLARSVPESGLSARERGLPSGREDSAAGRLAPPVPGRTAAGREVQAERRAGSLARAASPLSAPRRGGFPGGRADPPASARPPDCALRRRPARTCVYWRERHEEEKQVRLRASPSRRSTGAEGEAEGFCKALSGLGLTDCAHQSHEALP
ncbi:PREDICTED: collagen alpha-2(V) chain-like [Chinchilla lanigera]|uniref:collagen alpha-2(V) chain-like n=1 Tax=Chinchilla lanigera TaxID=34839 RepID=UPI000697C1AA|nr:PREDICTED: collagen alpha-2(V) chain-like [Chinchilla lanigera]